ncbi:MAG: hypothetical protein ACF8R9_05230 [Phycisphaerales bacterium JB054]
MGNFGHNRLGHQGLFADRYDTDAPAPDLAVDADVMYYARNRDCRPDLGRWAQGDPNGSGVALVLRAPSALGNVMSEQAKVYE